MTATPWGDLEQLCGHRLKPGPGGERNEVKRNQRERLFAATVVVVAERGYATTRVADVIELAGVSRSTFYRDFGSFHDCFDQALDSIVAGMEARMGVELEDDRPWDQRLRAYFGTLIDLVVAQPAAARLCLVEAYVAGPDAVARVDRVARVIGRRALAVLAESPERAGIPREVAGAVLGGLRTVIQMRLYTGREGDLPALASQLMDWALSYRTPPAPLRSSSPQPAAPATPGRYRLDRRQRIFDSITAVVARDGYAGTTVTEIAEVGAMSLSTFYDCFDDKHAAFVAALDDVMQRLLEVALPSYREAEDWPRGVRDGIGSLLAYVSHEPNIAVFVAETVWTSGPEAIGCLEERTLEFKALLAEGLRRRASPSGVAAEAIGASILALAYDGITRCGPERLYELAPPAAFVALAPAIGTIEACAIANEG